MTEKLSQSIKKIREQTPKLNAATDAANAAVLEVESFLEQSGIGLPAGLFAADAGEGYLELRYARWNNKFRICIATYECEIADRYKEVDVRPWSECARSDKLATFSALPGLLNAIADEVDKAIMSVQTTGEAIEIVMNSLQAK